MDLKLRLLLVFVIVSVLTHEITAQQPPLCQLPAEKGSCRAYLTRYAYNAASGQCERFIYSGCNANANNFKSMTECEDTCKLV